MNNAIMAARSVSALGTGTMASEYSGLTLTNKAQNIVVYVKTADTAIEQKLRAFLPTRLTFTVVPRSYQELQDLDARFTSAHDTLVQAGIRPVRWYPDPAQGLEVVQVMDMTPAEQADLTSRFPGQLKLSSIPAADQPTFFTNRITDSPLWIAGDFIAQNPSTRGTCTSGPATRNAAGEYWIMTDSHCFALGASVSNWSPDLSLGNKNNTIGIVKAQDLRQYGLDAELINAEGSDEYWAGTTDNPVGQFWRGPAPTNTGIPVCTEGAFDGEVCNLTVISVGATVEYCTAKNAKGTCISTRIITHVSTAQNDVGSGYAAGEGDSGGPVIEHSGGTWAVGIIEGSPGPMYSCSNWSHQLPNRQCSSTVDFTDIGPILSQWGLTMIGTG